MSATDNAFIKAYADELAVALGRPARRVGRPVNSRCANEPVLANETERFSLSSLFTEQVALPPVLDDSTVTMEVGGAQAKTAEAASGDHRAAVAQTRPSGPPETSSPDTLVSWLRIDRPDLELPPPVLGKTSQPRPAALPELPPSPEVRDDIASEVEFAVGGPASESFRPQWEVDRFRWPEVVEQLSSLHAESLTEVVHRLTMQRQNGPVVIAVTSYGRSEGRTTLALCLAKLAARSVFDVTVVDGDHDNPTLARQLGLSPQTGWDELAEDQPSISEVAVQSIEDRLSVLPLRDQGPGQTGVNRGRADAALATLATAHDLVLVDVGPMFTAGRRWLNRQSGELLHGALVVRDLRTTTDEQLADVIERLTERNIPVVGIAENFGSPSAGSNGEGGAVQ